MNFTKNDRGEYVEAVGAPSSIARVKVEYPQLISYLKNENADRAKATLKGHFTGIEFKSLLVASGHMTLQEYAN